MPSTKRGVGQAVVNQPAHWIALRSGGLHQLKSFRIGQRTAATAICVEQQIRFIRERTRRNRFMLTALSSRATGEPGDAANGERMYRACVACHSLEPNRNMTGSTMMSTGMMVEMVIYHTSSSSSSQ
jgi:hypothetical protein